SEQADPVTVTATTRDCSIPNATCHKTRRPGGSQAPHLASARVRSSSSSPLLIGVEYADGVVVQVGAGVAWHPGLVSDRTAGVTVVVADHEATRVGEPAAEALLPPHSIEAPTPWMRRTGG